MQDMKDATTKQLRAAKRFLSAQGVDKAGMTEVQIYHVAKSHGFTGFNVLPTAPTAPTAPAPTPTAPTAPTAPAPALDIIGAAINTAIDNALKKHDIKIDDEKIIELIQQHATTSLTVTNTATNTVNTIKGAHKALEKVVKLISNRIRPYLVGGAGTGKTTLAKQAADALSLDFYMTGAVLQKFELLGFIDANGTYHRTSFRDAYESGGVFLFDEQDASAEDALVAFNAALDNGFCVFPDTNITMHENFRPIAAANTVGTGATIAFTGRNAQDAAVLNRYFMLEITIDEKIETAMTKSAWLSAGGNKESTTWREWLSTLRQARKTCIQKGLHVQITPRDAEFGAKSLALGLSMRETIFGTFGSSLTDSHLKELGLTF